MRFTGERQVHASAEELWAALHDSEVLRRVIPGCERLVPIGRGRYAATLAARVGPLADTYRGHFTIESLVDGRALRVGVDGRGRFGRLGLTLDVALDPRTGHGTWLRYDAHATVGGMVARVGNPTMSVVGGHLTGCFFRDLDRALTRRAVAPARPAAAMVPQPVRAG